MKKRKQHIIPLILLVLFGFSSCYRSGLPETSDYLSRDMNFKQLSYTVNLGKNNVFAQVFNADYSSEPLTFSIENVRHFDGSAAPGLLNTTKARMWKDYFTGREESIKEIKEKQYFEQRPILDIRKHSGEIFFWKTDSNTVKPGVYWFDVKVSNAAGSRVFHDLMLNVRLPHPYDPYEFDDSSGLRLLPEEGGILHPTSVSGVVDMLNRPLPEDSVIVYFHKKGASKNTISFKFYDQDSLLIPISNFNMTQWDSLRYESAMTGEYVWPFAFNRRFNEDSTVLTYDITNPFPVLADVGSDKASITFRYNRISFGQRRNASIGLRFAIFEPGEWDIIFKFKINPKFEDD